jgi:hypothetical protein
MLIDDLLLLSTAAAPPCYEKTKASWILRLDSGGEVVDLSELQNELETLVPRLDRQGTAAMANTGLDNFTYLLGTGTSDRGALCHEAYRKMLASLDHPAARVIEKFLNNPARPVIVPEGCDAAVSMASHPSKGVGAKVVEITASTSTRPLIEIEGHPNWWQSTEVMRQHQARTEEVGGFLDPEYANWPCSLCGEEGKPLARLFPKSNRFGSRLISFNESATHAYGRKQGLVAPTCLACANAAISGLDYLHENGFAKFVADRFMVWWHEDMSLPSPWDNFKVATDPRSTKAERKAAVDDIAHDGRFAVLEKNQGRLILRHYAQVRASEVREGLGQWEREICSPGCRWTDTSKWPIDSIAWLISDNKAMNLEYLYRKIIANEEIPAGILRPARAYLRNNRSDLDSTSNRRRMALLRLASQSIAGLLYEDAMISHLNIDVITRDDLHKSLPCEFSMTAKERAAFVLGRLLARAGANQRRNSPKVQSSCVDTFRRSCTLSPVDASTALLRYRHIRGSGDDVAFEQLRSQFTGQAGLMADRFRRPMDQAERLAFDNGIYVQRGIHDLFRQAMMKAKAEREKEPKLASK